MTVDEPTNAEETLPEADVVPVYKDQAEEMNKVAKQHLTQGEWEPAVAQYEQVIALMEEAEDVAGKAEALNNIASVYLALKEWEKALDFAGQARALHQDIGDQAAEAVTMNNIAAAYDGLGNWAEAISIYEQALVLRGELNDREGEAKAKSYLNRALALARQTKSRALMSALRKTMSQLPRIRQRRGMPKTRTG